MFIQPKNMKQTSKNILVTVLKIVLKHVLKPPNISTSETIFGTLCIDMDKWILELRISRWERKYWLLMPHALLEYHVIPRVWRLGSESWHLEIRLSDSELWTDICVFPKERRNDLAWYSGWRAKSAGGLSTRKSWVKNRLPYASSTRSVGTDMFFCKTLCAATSADRCWQDWETINPTTLKRVKVTKGMTNWQTKLTQTKKT